MAKTKPQSATVQLVSELQRFGMTLSLYEIPAVVVHGNTISMEE